MKVPMCITVHGTTEDFVFMTEGDPKHLDEYWAQGIEIYEIVNSTFNVSANRIYDGGAVGTLCARDYKDPKCVRLSERPAGEALTGTHGIW